MTDVMCASRAGAWEGEHIVAYVCPGADHMRPLAQAAVSSASRRVALAINPRWDAMETPAVGAMEPVFCMTRSMSCGQRVTLLRVYPSGWHVYMQPVRGPAQLLAVEAKRPTMLRIAELVVQAIAPVPQQCSAPASSNVMLAPQAAPGAHSSDGGFGGGMFACGDGSQMLRACGVNSGASTGRGEWPTGVALSPDGSLESERSSMQGAPHTYGNALQATPRSCSSGSPWEHAHGACVATELVSQRSDDLVQLLKVIDDGSDIHDDGLLGDAFPSSFVRAPAHTPRSNGGATAGAFGGIAPVITTPRPGETDVEGVSRCGGLGSLFGCELMGQGEHDSLLADLARMSDEGFF